LYSESFSATNQETFQLYLAKPLSYVRGSHIPLYLRLSSQDTSILSVLCNPEGPLVRLMRNLSHFALGEEVFHGCNVLLPGGADNGTYPAGGLLPTTIRTKDRRLNLSSKEVSTAVWWVPPLKGTSQQTGVKWLEGELHLPGELKATNDCSLFSIEVVNTYISQCLSGYLLISGYYSTSSNCFLSGHMDSSQY